MIDIKKYRILTPAISTLNLNSDITIYLRNDEVETVGKDCTDKINLNEIAGVQCPEFNLVFKVHDKKFIKECQRSED